MPKLGSVGFAATAGLAAGGTAGQMLAKESSAPQDTTWQSAPNQYPAATTGSSGRWAINQVIGTNPATTISVNRIIFMPIFFPGVTQVSGLAVYAAAGAANAFELGGAGATGTGSATKPGSLLGHGPTQTVSTSATMAIADLTSSPITFPAGWSFVSVGLAVSFTIYGAANNPYRIPPSFNSTNEALSGNTYMTYTSNSSAYTYFDPSIVFNAQAVANYTGVTVWWRCL